MMTECWLKSNAKRILLPFRRFSILTIIIIVIIHFPRSPALCAHPGRWCPAIGLKVRTLLLPFVVLSKRWNTPEAICSIDTHTDTASQSFAFDICSYSDRFGKVVWKSVVTCDVPPSWTTRTLKQWETIERRMATTARSGTAPTDPVRPRTDRNFLQTYDVLGKILKFVFFLFLSMPPRSPITMQCIGWDRAFIRFLRAVVGSVPFAQQFSKHPAGDWALWCWMQSQQQGDGSALFLLVQWLPRISLAKVLLCCGSIVVDVNSLIDEGTKGGFHFELSFIL